MNDNVKCPKVSIVIISYNQAHFIREALDSVVTQDYPNLEIVVSDDASTDGTQDIIKEYQQKYPHLIKPLLADKNGGISVNVNRGLIACSGEFIAFMAGDDFFFPGKIRHQVELMMNNPYCSLSWHQAVIFDSDSKKTLGIIGRNALDILTARDLVEPGNWCAEGKGGFLPSSIMVRKALRPAEGFNEQIPLGSELLYIVEAARNGYILKLDGIWGAYRIQRGSACRANSKQVDKDFIDSLLYIHHHMPDLSEIIYKYNNLEIPISLIDSGQIKSGRLFLLKQFSANPFNLGRTLYIILIYLFPKGGIATYRYLTSRLQAGKGYFKSILK